MPAPLPPDETGRLQTLARYDVIDTQPDATLDRLTALAARLFDAPIALVSLVDKDRQWFKSRHGLAVCETPRDHSFCAHAILPQGDEPMIVRDAALDARFADNPLVTGPPGVRFYAGVPLRAPDNGAAIGSFCILDTRPRDFSVEEAASLRDLAAAAADILELHVARQLAREEAAERQWIEQALRQSEARLRRMAANSPAMLYQFVLNPDGSYYFPFVSEGCRQFYGVEPQAIYDRPEIVFDALTPEFQAGFRESVAASARTLQPWQMCAAYRAPDGSTRWMEGSSLPETLDEGKMLWNGMLMDITERVRAQRQIEDNHRLMRAIINGTDNHIFIKDRDSRYLLINPSGAALLGTTPEEVVGKDDAAFFPPGSARGNRESDLEIMRTGESRTYESSDLINGVEHVFLSTKSPYRDAAGNLIGIIGIAREITEQRRAAMALREAKEEAENANAAKSEFLSRMSHELRTPLNAILGFGQLLELDDLGKRQSEGVGHILKAGRHLLKLIDEVLAISRIEAGRMNLSLEPVAVGEMVAECLSLVSRQADERRITLDNRCEPRDPGMGAFVQADRQRLRQVLLNLLSNAIKYNREAGRVTISCHESDPGADGEPPRLRLEVIDTGRGLTPEDIGRLFTPFERLGAERGPVEGTGLGLALSKGLIEAMGGRIEVRGVPGEGSTFSLELPLAHDPLQALGVGNGVGAKSGGAEYQGSVLYVEDNLSNLRLIEMLLDDQPGLELFSAQQGLLGLEIARARQPHLILLDLHLPDLPGWEVLALLQDDPETRDIPVVVISADATPGRIERLKAAGAREYLTKPIDVPTLMAVLRQYLHPSLLEQEAAVPA